MGLSIESREMQVSIKEDIVHTFSKLKAYCIYFSEVPFIAKDQKSRNRQLKDKYNLFQKLQPSHLIPGSLR